MKPIKAVYLFDLFRTADCRPDERARLRVGEAKLVCDALGGGGSRFPWGARLADVKRGLRRIAKVKHTGRRRSALTLLRKLEGK